MDCIEIIKQYLGANGFDGLMNGAECGCEIPDLVPCGDDFRFCTPGYKVAAPEDSDCEYDFYICANKTDSPWETED